MSYKRDENGDLILGPDGHPIPEKQGVVEAKMEPIQHKRSEAGGGARAEGVTIGELIPDPAPVTPPAPKKGS